MFEKTCFKVRFEFLTSLLFYLLYTICYLKTLTAIRVNLCYAIGDNPYGPFTYKGVILTPVVGWTTHHGIIEFKGKWYLFHHDSVPSGGRTWLRSVKVTELEYNEDGTIKTIEGTEK